MISINTVFTRSMWLIGFLILSNSVYGDVSIDIVSKASAPQANVPVTFGQTFAPGDVTAGTRLTARLANGASIPVQVDGKAVHSDGSLRHGIVTVMVPELEPGGVRTVTLLDGPGGEGSVVSLEGLLQSGFDAVVEVVVDGSTYRGSVSGGLNVGDPKLWLSGPLVSEWVVGAGLQDSGGGQHPHLQAYFHVRAYAGYERVRVDVVIENNWAFEPGPRNFDYDVAIEIAGRQVYSKSALKHFHHARWHKQFWVGPAPQVHVKHDIDYLIESRAVPNYDRSLVIPETKIASEHERWVAGSASLSGIPFTEPMSPGFITERMGNAGAQPTIGLLPRYDLFYLLSMDARAKQVSLGTGDAGGSWSIHYRDRDTGLPLSIDDYPYVTIVGSGSWNPILNRDESFPSCGGSCSTEYKPAISHLPSIAYVPYLVTGDYYYLEEIQQWANWAMIHMNYVYRQREKGVFHSRKFGQVRSQAWSLRSLAQAAYITPDAHPMKAYFEQKLQNNIEEYTREYAENPNANRLGVHEGGSATPYYSGAGAAPWQHNFFVSVLGYIGDLGYSSVQSAFSWFADFELKQLNDPSYCHIAASLYKLKVRDIKGSPYYTSIGDAYAATVGDAVLATECGSAEMASVIDAPGTIIPGKLVGYTGSPTGYPSNLQPAVAYIADYMPTQGGGQAWNTFAAAFEPVAYASYPNFAVRPRTIDVIPSISMIADQSSVLAGGSVTLSWEANDADSCEASGSWFGTKALSGSEEMSSLLEPAVFILTCSNNNHSVSNSIEISIFEPVTVDIIASPQSIYVGESSELSWSSTNADSCFASGDWGGAKAASGSESYGPLETDGLFTLTCDGPMGTTATAEVPVSVLIRPSTDTDSDGLPDVWEYDYFGSLTETPEGDADLDGVSNASEYAHNTDPMNEDTDGDGDTDASEIQHGSDPLVALDTVIDHQPLTPMFLAVDSSAVPLLDAEFQTTGFADPDPTQGLLSTEWQIAKDEAFQSLVFQRETTGLTRVILSLGMLDPQSSYFIRARHWDSTQLHSDWSESVQFYTQEKFAGDSDANGIADQFQVNSPVDTDANGVIDVEEGMCNLSSYSGGQALGLRASQGEIKCFTVSEGKDIGGVDSDTSVPFGLFTFRVDGLNVSPLENAGVDVTIYFPENLAADAHWYKYDPINHIYQDISDYVTMSDNWANIRIEDGGQLDIDGVINGSVLDPGGPVYVASASGGLPGSSGGADDQAQAPVEDGEEEKFGIGSTSWPDLIVMILFLLVVTRRNRFGQRWRQGNPA